MTPPYKPQEVKEAKEAELEESERRFKQKRELEQIAQKYYRKLHDEKLKDQELFNKAKEFIKDQPQEDKERLATWFLNYGKVYDIPDRSWWLEIMGMPPETRATIFWTKYIQSNEKKKEEMKKLAHQIPGIISKRFNVRFNLLMKKWEKENE